MNKNIKKALDLTKDSNLLVLDVGGWTRPLARANYVIDFNPYETRGKMGLVGDGPEKFNKNTWIVHDICSRKPFPFKDKQFDFVFCGHTLEDLKDPVWVCSEIIRVGKGGYIETPSRWAESKTGVGGSLKFPQKLAGYFNHLWFVEVIDGELVFTIKNSLIHVLRDFQIKKVISPILGFFWENSFKYREKLILSLDDAVYDLLDFKLKEAKNKRECQKLKKRAKRFLSLTFFQGVKIKLKQILSPIK